MCSFLEEASIMSTFEHPNVLSLIGVALDHQEKPYVVLPFMENGDLKTFVSSSSKASDSSILMKKRNYVYSFKVGQSWKKLTAKAIDTININLLYGLHTRNLCNNGKSIILSAPLESAFIKLRNIIWTSVPYTSIIQHADIFKACIQKN